MSDEGEHLGTTDGEVWKWSTTGFVGTPFDEATPIQIVYLDDPLWERVDLHHTAYWFFGWMDDVQVWILHSLAYLVALSTFAHESEMRDQHETLVTNGHHKYALTCIRNEVDKRIKRWQRKYDNFTKCMHTLQVVDGVLCLFVDYPHVQKIVHLGSVPNVVLMHISEHALVHFLLHIVQHTCHRGLRRAIFCMIGSGRVFALNKKCQIDEDGRFSIDAIDRLIDSMEGLALVEEMEKIGREAAREEVTCNLK